jgi:hypothetical protein
MDLTENITCRRLFLILSLFELYGLPRVAARQFFAQGELTATSISRDSCLLKDAIKASL